MTQRFSENLCSSEAHTWGSASSGSVRTTEAAVKNQPAQLRTAARRRTSLAPESIAAVLVGENRGPTAGEIHPEAAAVTLLLWASSFSISMPDDTSFRHASTRLGGKTKESYWVEVSLDFSREGTVINFLKHHCGGCDCCPDIPVKCHSRCRQHIHQCKLVPGVIPKPSSLYIA